MYYCFPLVYRSPMSYNKTTKVLFATCAFTFNTPSTFDRVSLVNSWVTSIDMNL